ncbi:MAG: hypothetical protein GY940_16235 [bacterium]|nr:hypothetical protein [bacterium]
MKQTKTKQLYLNKVTIQNLGIILDKDEQKKVKGGTYTSQNGSTQIPIYC